MLEEQTQKMEINITHGAMQDLDVNFECFYIGRRCFPHETIGRTCCYSLECVALKPTERTFVCGCGPGTEWQENLLLCKSGLTPIGDLVLVVVCIVAVIAVSVLIYNLVPWRKRRRARNAIAASTDNSPSNRENEMENVPYLPRIVGEVSKNPEQSIASAPPEFSAQPNPHLQPYPPYPMGFVQPSQPISMAMPQLPALPNPGSDFPPSYDEINK